MSANEVHRQEHTSCGPGLERDRSCVFCWPHLHAALRAVERNAEDKDRRFLLLMEIGATEAIAREISGSELHWQSEPSTGERAGAFSRARAAEAIDDAHRARILAEARLHQFAADMAAYGDDAAMIATALAAVLSRSRPDIAASTSTAGIDVKAIAEGYAREARVVRRPLSGSEVRR